MLGCQGVAYYGWEAELPTADRLRGNARQRGGIGPRGRFRAPAAAGPPRSSFERQASGELQNMSGPTLH